MKGEFQKDGDKFGIQLERTGNSFVLETPTGRQSGEILRWERPEFVFRMAGKVRRGYFYAAGDFVDVHLPEGNFRLRWALARRAGGSHAAGSLSSPMPGKVIKILVKTGDAVQKGDLLMVLEAMKMEHKVLSPKEGKVGKIFFKEEDRVGQEVELLELSDG